MPNALRIFFLISLPFALAGVVYLWRRIRIQEMGRQRLAEPEALPSEAPERASSARPFIQRYPLVPWAAALVLAGVAYYFVGLPFAFAAAFGLVAGLLGGQLESFLATGATYRIEQQLGDAIDLMVAALRAGAGALSALDSAAREARRPLKEQLEEVLGRIRYGDDPQAVFRALEQRVPLETFRLFASALSVHWETGGSLAPTLATVGRVIRDRIEVNRRIRSLTAQARVSTISILGVTYFLAVLIWRNDPERMRQFLSTAIGRNLAAGAIVLQAVGIVWSAALSRLKY
ncbi:MAG: type II secretion system F family protein [Planctomycetes bacterium]|nr:type II secretion system F family protein [Planctomycetota bacterium]